MTTRADLKSEVLPYKRTSQSSAAASGSRLYHRADPLKEILLPTGAGRSKVLPS